MADTADPSSPPGDTARGALDASATIPPRSTVHPAPDGLPLRRADPLGVDASPDWPRSTPAGGAELRAAFERQEQLGIGVEEELMVVSTETLALRPAAPEVVAVLGDPHVSCELLAAQIEAITPVCSNAGEAGAELRRLRRAITAALPADAALAGAGTHPLARGPLDVTPGPRYEMIAEAFGYVATHVMPLGLHVHVSVQGAERTLAVFNALRAYLPELLAFSANSPYLGGTDTGLSSIRATMNAGYPRGGVPPLIESWDELARLIAWGRRTRAFPDSSYLWWDARPNPRHGTIEVRVLDAQTTVEDATALAAIVHALVHHLADRHDDGRLPGVPQPPLLAENRWRALRHGMRGSLIDLESGEVVPTRDRMRRLLEELGPSAAALGTEQEMAHARTLLAGTGAERQRAVGRAAGVDRVVRWLIAQNLEDLGWP